MQDCLSIAVLNKKSAPEKMEDMFWNDYFSLILVEKYY